MRVLLVDPSLYTPPYDGALAAALTARGHDVLLAGRPRRATDPPFGGPVDVEAVFYRRGESLRGRSRVAPLVKGLEHSAGLAELERRVREWRPDVVHWQWPSLPLLDAKALGRLARFAPQVVTVHDARVFKSKAGARRLQTLGWGRFVRAAQAVIAHVRGTRDTLRGFGVPDSRIAIVPHPIFEPARTGASRAGDVVRAGRALRVLFFGRLSRDKGIDVLAAALERLDDEARRGLELTVCGPPILEDAGVAEALARLRRLPGVELVAGFVPEPVLDAQLATTDLVVLPHREVDASGVLMKALGHDVGVVAADVPAFREVLDGAPVVRWFERGRPEALAAVLASLAADPAAARELGAGAARLRTGGLSWARAAELTEAVYERCPVGPAAALAAGSA